MIARISYIKQLGTFVNKPFIKVITGIRRSGKSSVLLLLRNELLSKGIEESRIIYLNFESFSSAELQNAIKLYDYIKTNIPKAKKAYLLLDEIQEVADWEKCVNSLLVDFDVDIYLTGSNSHLLSSELATFIAGRYVEIPVFTLSFAEYLQFRTHYFSEKEQDMKNSFVSYLRLGGFPVIHTADYSEETAWKIVQDIYASVILRDTVQRYKIRDVELLERIVRYAFDNIGNTFSGKNVADYFKSQQRKIDINTVYNYLHALEGAFVLYRVPRYDIKGREILKTQEKFYVGDISLLYAVMGYKDRWIAGIMENIVFLELKRRGYRIFVGKLDTREIDFIAEKQGKKIYIQVAYKLDREDTVAREFNTLLEIKDQFPKFVITMDDFWQESVEGVRHLHISDFLLNDV
ncbi:MAG: ATP-binding protein [Tannerellaceae bacterium]|jgi:predicted AAA+ superfamily ATPase|nr:ATP-binding protein [Tannerellaceae bacterium]